MVSMVVLAGYALTFTTASVDTVRAIPVSRLGAESTGADGFLFGEVSGMALDASARLFVTDFQEPRVVVLDSTGRVLGIIGRRGEGPGEFLAPTGPVVSTGGVLYVRNMTKISRFVRDPRTRLPSRFDRYIDGPAMLAYRTKLPTVLDSADRIHWPNPWTPRGRATRMEYLRYDSSGKPLSALRAPTYSTAAPSTAWVRTGAGGGRTVEGLNNVPFAAQPVYAVTSRGTIVTGGGEHYELAEVNAEGRVVRRFRQRIVPRRIPATERAESLRALRRRIDSLPVPIARLEGTTEAVRRQDLPHTFPPYTGVVAQPDGSTWVRQWPTRPNETSYDVFDGAAVFRYTLVIPARCEALPPPVSNGRHIVCLTVDEDSGEETILWFGISVR